MAMYSMGLLFKPMLPQPPSILEMPTALNSNLSMSKTVIFFFLNDALGVLTYIGVKLLMFQD